MDDKWIEFIEAAIKGEIDHISQHPTNRIKELTKYKQLKLGLMQNLLTGKKRLV